jgi:hypothetical protein
MLHLIYQQQKCFAQADLASYLAGLTRRGAHEHNPGQNHQEQ